MDAVVYTRDKAVMRKLDALVNEFLKVTDIDKIYFMPKQYVKYRKPRRISKELKERRRDMMNKLNNNGRVLLIVR